LILIHRPGAHHEICRCPTRRSSDLGTESMDFSEWRSHWGPGTEVDAHADVVLWQRQWSDKRFYNLVPADFTLDRTAPGNNPAISGAINGDAGVDITGLERLMTLPIPLPDETTSAPE